MSQTAATADTASLSAADIDALVRNRVKIALNDPAPVDLGEPRLDGSDLKRMVKWIGVLATIGPILVSGVLWFLSVGGDWREQELERVRLQNAQHDTAERLNNHIARSDKTWQEIKTATIENQVLIVESIDHLGNKIDKVSTRAQDVEEPQVLEDARAQSKKAKARQALFSK